MESNITTTHVYKVNGRLVVADSPIEAINLFIDYYKKTYHLIEEVQSLKCVLDDSITCPSSSALIRQQKEITNRSSNVVLDDNVIIYK